MWKPDHEEGWVPKNWGFLTVVLEKTVENPLDSRWVKPVNPKGNQPWIFTARNGYLRSSWSSYTSATWSKELTHWKGPWCWQRLGTLGEGDDRGWDGWHHQLDGHEFQQALVTVKDREAWNAAAYDAEKSQTQLSDWTKQRFVVTFLARSKHLLISWLQLPSAVIMKPKGIKSVTIYTFSSFICHEVMGMNAMIFVFQMLSFMPAFSPSFFTLIKRLFSSLSLSAIRVVSFA